MKTLPFLASPLFRASRHRAAPHAVSMALYFFAGLADGALVPFFALWAQHAAGIPTRFIGLLLACYAGGELLATPFLGGIADRMGRRPVLLCSTLGVGGGFLLLAHAHGVVLVALSLLAIGVSECALHPTISTVIADVAPPGQLRMRFASARIASGVGHVAGPALGAGLALVSLNAVFVGCGLSLLCAALVAIALLPETRGLGREEADDDDGGLSALFPAFRDRRLAVLLLWFAVLEIVGGWVEAVTPLYAHGAQALSAAGVGLLFTYADAVAVLVQWPVAKWSERLATFPLLLVAGIALAGGLGLLLVPPGIVSLGASMSLIALAQALFGPLVPVLVDAMAPPSSRASYMAAMSTMNDLKDTAGPASGIYLYGVSARLPWLLGMPLVLLAAWALAMRIRRQEQAGGMRRP